MKILSPLFKPLAYFRSRRFSAEAQAHVKRDTLNHGIAGAFLHSLAYTSGGVDFMKSLRISALIAAALVVAPVLYAGDFGVRAGRYNDTDEEFVGIEALYDLGAIKLNPNLEYSLQDDVTAGSANFDVTVDIFSIGNITPYVGAGVGMLYVDDDVRTRTDVLGNLIGGVSVQLEFLEPYAQLKYFRVLDKENGADEEDDFALTIGLRF
jgi:hypothetical protein